MAYTFNPFTGTFDNAPSTLNGDSAYSTLCAISGDLVRYSYLHDGFLPLSGGTVTGNLSVEGGFEINGSAGPATIYAGSSLVGINTETPNEELTVQGDISASGIIYGDASGLVNVIDSEVRSLSSFWDSTTTAYTQASGTFATTDYVHINFLPLTGGTVDGNLDVTGTTNLSGETSIRAGATVTLHVVDTLVGINTESPNEALTVVGNISATGTIYGSASGLTDVVDSGVRSLTANWESTYNTVSSLSALWEESAEILPTVTNYLSTNNVLISSLTLIETLSVGGALEVGGGGAGTVDLFVGTSTVGINTETPNEALTVNGSISANSLIYDETGNSSQWNSVYSSVTLTSANWDSVYSYTNSVSSDLVFTDTSNTTPGLSAVTKIVAVSALPATQETGTLYILI